MRKLILMLVLVTGVSFLKAQNVGISASNTVIPRDCAMLDIVSSTKGLLIPTFTLTSMFSFSPATGTQVEGLLVYNNGSSGNYVSPKGFYFWANAKWNLLCICSGTDIVSGGKVTSAENEQSLSENIQLSDNNFNNPKQSIKPQNSDNIMNSSFSKELTFNGSVKFVKGIAEVIFDNEFSQLCDLKSLIITATPLGNCKGIYIDEITDKGFRIKELRKGKSNIKVNFIVIGKLKSSPSPKD